MSFVYKFPVVLALIIATLVFAAISLLAYYAFKVRYKGAFVAAAIASIVAGFVIESAIPKYHYVDTTRRLFPDAARVKVIHDTRAAEDIHDRH